MPDVFAVWKPKGPSSNQFLNRIRAATGVRSIGHAGTLDPLAEGILVVGIGSQGTKALASLVANEKEYQALVRLGVSSTTDDGEGQKTEMPMAKQPTKLEIVTILPKFIGIINQVPPIFSAIKVSGKRAYELARAGKAPELQSRPILIKELEIIDYTWPRLKIRVVTGPGAYIRALARDLGVALGGGAYLEGLVRTRVGSFAKSEAVSLDELAERFRVG